MTVAKKRNREPVSYSPEQYAALEAQLRKVLKRNLLLDAQNVSLKNGIIVDAENKPLNELSPSQLNYLAGRLKERMKKLKQV